MFFKLSAVLGFPVAVSLMLIAPDLPLEVTKISKELRALSTALLLVVRSGRGRLLLTGGSGGWCGFRL